MAYARMLDQALQDAQTLTSLHQMPRDLGGSGLEFGLQSPTHHREPFQTISTQNRQRAKFHSLVVVLRSLLAVEHSSNMTQPKTPANAALAPNNDQAPPGFDRGFLAIALHLNRLRLLTLQDLRDQHDGDLDQAQVACALMTVTVGGNLRRSNEALQRLNTDGLPDPALGPWPKRSQRIRELVAATGLPRETVRRKLHQLEASGAVERDASGGWLWATAQAGQTRDDYREEARRLLVAVEQLRELLRNSERMLRQ